MALTARRRTAYDFRSVAPQPFERSRMVGLSRGDLAELRRRLWVVEEFQQSFVRCVRVREERYPGCETCVGISLVKNRWNKRRDRGEQLPRCRGVSCKRMQKPDVRGIPCQQSIQHIGGCRRMPSHCFKHERIRRVREQAQVLSRRGRRFRKIEIVARSVEPPSTFCGHGAIVTGGLHGSTPRSRVISEPSCRQGQLHRDLALPGRSISTSIRPRTLTGERG